MNILIVVTHLLGTGHLARAMTLARAMIKAGDTVSVVSGGMPVPHLDRGDVSLVQLPPLRSDGVDFTRLLDAEGALANDALRAKRAAMLLDHLHSADWDVIITELFPFGRRILRDEFQALLHAAHAMPRRPLICASIRDILAPPSKPEKAAKTDAIIAQFYDAVLVHSDPDIMPLEVSWPVTDALRAKLKYTGFVAPPPATMHPDRLGQDEVIVTAGGGNVGAPIFRAAIESARSSPLTWRVLLGGKDAATRASTLSQDAPDNVIVEPARPDFRQMLYHCAAHVGMCGYNTALDVLQSACPAVFIPFDDGNEVEQTLRANALASLDAITVLPTAQMTPATLLATIDKVVAAPARVANADQFQGASATALVVHELREAST